MFSTVRLLFISAVLASGIAATAASAQASPLQLASPVTDNYKASYNADPSAPESRTWLSTGGIVADGLTFQVATLPADHAFTTAADGVDLIAPDGTTAHLTASTTSPNATGQGTFRVDADGRFGILVTVKDRSALSGSPILETLTLSEGAQIAGTTTVVYAYDPTVADVPASSIEFNGPGGRWLVGGAPTPLDWQVGTPSSPAPDPVLDGSGTPSGDPAGGSVDPGLGLPVGSDPGLEPPTGPLPGATLPVPSEPVAGAEGGSAKSPVKAHRPAPKRRRKPAPHRRRPKSHRTARHVATPPRLLANQRNGRPQG